MHFKRNLDDPQDMMDSSGSCDPICSVDEPSSSYFEANYQPKTDIVKAIAVFAAALTGTAAINHSWVAANQVSCPRFVCNFLFHTLNAELKF